MTAVMSTSLNVVSIAAVCCASTSRLAMVARRLDMRTRSSRSPAGRGAGDGGGAGLATGGGDLGCAGSTSAAVAAQAPTARVTRSPSVLTLDNDTSCSRAAFRAEGVAPTGRAGSATCADGEGAAPAGAAAVAGAGVAGAPAVVD